MSIFAGEEILNILSAKLQTTYRINFNSFCFQNWFVSNSQFKKKKTVWVNLGMVAHAFNSSLHSGCSPCFQGHGDLHSEFQASQSYIVRLVLEKQNNNGF